MGKLFLFVALAAFVAAPLMATEKAKEEKKSAKTACANHKKHDHKHGKDCGHESVEHEGHVDYKHDGHLHADHEGHYDEHKTN